MANGDSRFAMRVPAAIAAGFALTLVFAAPASAGIFDQLFGGLSRTFASPPPLPTNVQPYAAPSAPERDITRAPARRAEAAPYSAQCVRTCDGYHFPVHAYGNIGAAEMCHAFCPGSATKLYSGGGIEHAVAADGSRYSNLDTAFLYRKRVVAGCTCNGRDAFGLAHIDVNTDPSLRPGDVVATKHGLVAATGRNGNVANFTPVQSDRSLSKSYRDKLSALKVTPPQLRGPVTETPVELPLAANVRHDERRAQLDR
jgi:Protein of unknown function (DUF2865)